MKKKIPIRLLSLFMSGILAVTSVEMPVHATEESAVAEQTGGNEADLTEDVSTEVSFSSTETSSNETSSTEASSNEASSMEDSSAETSPLEESATEDLSMEESSMEESPTEKPSPEEGGTTTEPESDITESETEPESFTEEEETTEQETIQEYDQEEVSSEDELPDFSVSVANPHYEGILDEEQEDEWDSVPLDRASVTVRSATKTFSNVQEAAEYVRGQMVMRAETVVFNVPGSLVSTSEEFMTFVADVIDTAVAHTESCSGQEGDALAWGYKGYGVRGGGTTQSYQLIYTFTYHTTHEQEQQLTSAVNDAMQSMGLDGKSDYEKVERIHDYICDHVDYDYSNDGSTLKHSAYAALCTGKAVCQGYAILFYRMCKEAGLSVRLIPGTGSDEPHAWNIVRIGTKAKAAGEYYNVDCTWDGQDAKTWHTYFLLNREDFLDHWRDSSYDTTAFHNQYPMSAVSYRDEYGGGAQKLNLENPSLELNMLGNNEEILRTDADGKAKVLIFYGVDSSGSQSTMYSIVCQKFTDVDIYAIASGDGKDMVEAEVKRFKYQFGGKDIVFTFGEKNVAAFNEYLNLAGYAGETVPIPVICYIDADNKFQHITFSTSSGTIVAKNLEKYCGVQPVTPAPSSYTISYILYGGTNNTGNPSDYTPESDTIILLDPVREGYTFAGWYSDASFLQRVTQIEKGSLGDRTFYAKWEETVPIPDSSALPQIDMTLTEGNILMGIPGTYHTETAETILNRLNEIRLEACREGLRNPDTGKALTMEDYKPLKWSADMEAIARLRAAEASVYLVHTRPNGKGSNTVTTTNGKRSSAENLEWSFRGLMYGIEDWYSEKESWVNGGGAIHYTSIISPGHQYVAVAVFEMEKGARFRYCVAQEFSGQANLDTRKDDTAGKCIQKMEIMADHVSELAFDAAMAASLEEGSTYNSVVNAAAVYTTMDGFTATGKGAVLEGGTWQSSDETVATVDAKGTITALKKGTTTITVTVGKETAKKTIEVYKAGENPLQLTRPDKTIYKTGEALDVSGGQVTDQAGNTVSLTKDMVSGFSSDTAGIFTVSVTHNGYATYYNILVVEEPKLSAKYGQKLSELTLPVNEYGTWSWADGDWSKTLEETGVHKYKVTFTPKDQTAFRQRTDLEAEVRVQRSLSGMSAALKNSSFVYNGAYHEPEVIVSAEGKILKEGGDYTLSYLNNKNAGTAYVVVTGTNGYEGELRVEFQITPARLVITAKDKTVAGGNVPAEFEYEISGLVAGDALVAEPEITCSAPADARSGVYEIIPQNAKATADYDSAITYVKGRLILAEEPVAYIVAYDNKGHGTTPEKVVGSAGTLVTPPTEPFETGYIFGGWYQDAECTKAWNFETDILTSDLTLYAKWLTNSNAGSFSVQEIADVYYTGSACKPKVSIYDGEKLLTLNKDYKITYGNNNTNVNTIKKTGNGAGNNFNETLPSVTITGKGNYTESIPINFNILPSPIADENGNPANGITLKYTDQSTVSKTKPVVPFKSVKYKKALVRDKDFTVSVKPIDAFNAAGEKCTETFGDGRIPAGYTGKFALEVRGTGNYEGTIVRDVYVLESSKLIKNAKITLGAQIRSVKLGDYDNGKAVLVPAYYVMNEAGGKKYYKYKVENGRITQETEVEADTKSCFTVICGGESLRYQQDYTVAYDNNDKTGTATMTITGTGSRYAGSKTVTFKITGDAFKANKVDISLFEKEMVYTGKAQTQNGVALMYKGESGGIPLTYGKDYTISYKKNINKGTATMTFKAAAGSRYTGSFNKTFKIVAADISSMRQGAGMDSIRVPYEKAGAKPASAVVLINENGNVLQSGRDYTVSFRNNKAVAEANAGADTAPTIIINGKGNYQGMREIPFAITPASLGRDNSNITVEAASIVYKQGATAVYEPAIKVKDNKSTLKAPKDYTVDYQNNSSEDFENYLAKLRSGSPDADSLKPAAVITGVQGGSYEGERLIPLPIYENKLAAKNLYVVVGQDTVYTGKQLTPDVKVYYSEDSRIVSDAKKMAQPSESELTKLGLKLLDAETEYTVSYGANINAGKNKGSVTIRGEAPYYGGSVTVKFTIQGKGVVW